MDGAQLAQQLAVEVLQTVALVHHNVLPGVALQVLHIRYHYLVRCHHHWEGVLYRTCTQELASV